MGEVQLYNDKQVNKVRCKHLVQIEESMKCPAWPVIKLTAYARSVVVI